MRSSTIIASLFATLAVAAPAHQALHKKAIVWDIKTEIVTVTVTAGDEPSTVHVQKTVFVAPQPATTTKKKTSKKTTKTTVKTTTTTTTTTTTPPPPPPTTTQPPPQTTQAPPPVVEETPEPVQEQAPAPQAVAPSSSTGNGVRDAALNAHNAYRAKHHAGPVSWDDSLASSAQALASGCTNQHGMIVGGQNIAAKGLSGDADSTSLMTSAVDMWYDEVNSFGPYYGQSDVGDSSVLHFTQVVWKSTTRIGCAVANCGTGSSFFPGFNAYTMVCNYQAAGNFGGQYAENVSPP